MPTVIELRADQIQTLMTRLETRTLQEEDYEIIKAILESYALLGEAYLQKNDSIRRLLRMIFGPRTESSRNVLDKSGDDEPPPPAPPEKEPEPRKKRKGHGKIGADAHKGAQRIPVPHESLKPGDPCLVCPNGKVYPLRDPATVVRFTGQPPIACTIYELERLRCNLCGEVFTAAQPPDAKKATYDEKAVAMMANLKYGNGMPFFRLEGLQESLGILLPASNQWEALKASAAILQPVFGELIRQGACGELLQHDDTPAKILSLIKENEKNGAERKGIQTTGMVCSVEQVKIVLFFTGSRHAGENLAVVLAKRSNLQAIPTVMCDALSRNIPPDFEILLANCLAHGRRKFVDILSNFPGQCAFVIEKLAEVYKNEAFTRDHHMSADERLHHHQLHSAPLMNALHTWLKAQLEGKKVEPNSGLGKAIKYMLKHWEPLTLFLRVPGAPLDNNLTECILKCAVLHRKNSYFFKTQRGADVGDLYMSLIHTCKLNDVNPVDYIAVLLENGPKLLENPGQWMPWNYQSTLENHPNLGP